MWNQELVEICAILRGPTESDTSTELKRTRER